MFKKLKFHVVGVVPCLMHNIRLADPLDEFAKEIKRLSKVKPKTDEIIVETFRVEFLGSLYLDENKEPCVPGEIVEAMLVKAAKSSRRGSDAKAGIVSYGNWPLIYDGPRDADALWELPLFRDIRAVRVKSARVMRCRPIFHEWEFDCEVEYMTDQCNEEDVRNWFKTAGDLCGMMDYRPRFGRFNVS
jgi:hypothetical protein